MALWGLNTSKNDKIMEMLPFMAAILKNGEDGKIFDASTSEFSFYGKNYIQAKFGAFIAKIMIFARIRQTIPDTLLPG